MSDAIMKSENTATDFDIPTGYICTVDINTDKGAISVANALSASDPLSQHMNEELIVVDIITVPGERSVSKDPCTNTHLILEDGTTLFSQSDGVSNSARNLAAAFGIKIHRGIIVKCIEQPLRNGNTMKTLRVVGFADVE